MRERCDPFGNVLPLRMHFKNGAYYHVRRRPRGAPRWRRLAAGYPGALREWARMEGAGQYARTVAQAIEAYLIERGPELAPKTLTGYESSARRILEWAGPVFLDELSKRDVRLWLHARSAAVSANRDIALLRAAYSHAVECGWCEANPATGVRRRTERPRRRVATPAELRTLAENATPMWRAILATAVLTGMREGELRLLRRDALTDEGILLTRPKTGAESLIEWTPALREAIGAALSAQRIESLYVVPSRKGGPFTEHGFRTAWRRLCDRAGVGGLQFRDLRRTAATIAATLEDARDLLGHTSTAITRRVYRTRNRVKPTRRFKTLAIAPERLSTRYALYDGMAAAVPLGRQLNVRLTTAGTARLRQTNHQGAVSATTADSAGPKKLVRPGKVKIAERRARKYRTGGTPTSSTTLTFLFLNVMRAVA